MNRICVSVMVILLLVFATVLAGCGDDDDGGNESTATSVAPTATTGSGAVDPTSTTSDPTPTSAAATSTQSADASATTPAEAPSPTPTSAEQLTLNVYFIRDEQLTVAHRTIPHTLEVGAAAMTQLLEGPTAEEAALGFTTAIPDETEFLGLEIQDGVATVDLSAGYESGGGSFAVTARLAQVVYTLTQFPSVESVEFLLEGEPVEVFSGEGVVLDGPVGRDFEDLLPAILVESVAAGDEIESPVQLAGSANTFEATFAVRILGAGEEILTEQIVTATSGSGTRGTFEVSVPFEVEEATPGKVVVFEYSARDGSPIHIIEIPVVLRP